MVDLSIALSPLLGQWGCICNCSPGMAQAILTQGEVMATPIAVAVGHNGGEVRTNAKVTRLLTGGQRMHGVESAGEQIAANHVVLVTSLASARQLIRATMEGAVVFGKLAADIVEAACQLDDFPAMTGAVMR